MRLCKGLNDIVGHKPIVKWFDNCIKKDILPQVILLDGVAGIGKSSIAKIVACEIACKAFPDRLEETKRIVIEEDKSTDAVKLFNMSNLKSQDAVLQVRSELNIGMSSTGRKAIIMDEAHGMNQEAQDSLLTAFEALPLGVYIFICTTDISNLEDAFVSRCLRRSLKGLSEQEISSLIRQRIVDNNLKFQLREAMAVKLISTYTGREPRRAINLLDSFEKGTTISNEDLETFFSLDEANDILILAQYLYKGDILNGLRFIKDVDISPTFVSTLLEMARVAKGDATVLLERNALSRFMECISIDEGDLLLGFTIEISIAKRLTRNLMSGLFLKWCNHKLEAPMRYSENQIQKDNSQLLSNMVDSNADVTAPSETQIDVVETLDDLFEQGDDLQEGAPTTYDFLRKDLGI